MKSVGTLGKTWSQLYDLIAHVFILKKKKKHMLTV